MKSIYFPQHGGVNSEQSLVQNLIDEQIKLFGSDVYYLPRKLFIDKAISDIVYSEFKTQYMIEMLLINVEGFGSPSEFISKFGLRVTDEVTFVVSSNRWSQIFNNFADITAVDGRPNEGDLIYFPLTENVYEIKFVERLQPFYQLGKLYYYTMTAELYEAGDDKFETGIEDIDEIEEIFAVSSNIQMSTTQTGEYTQGEIVTGSLSGVNAEVSYWNRNDDVLVVINRTGNFNPAEKLLGDQSGANRNIVSIDNLSIDNVEYADNKYIEEDADDILDFEEKNPFGEYGQIGGDF